MKKGVHGGTLGQPTKYNPERCSKLIELMKQGYSIEEVCLEFDICCQTHYNWLQNHPEYVEAVEKGEKYALAWHLKQARENFHNKGFNDRLYNIIMQNKFGFNRKVQQEVHLTTHEDLLKELK